MGMPKIETTTQRKRRLAKEKVKREHKKQLILQAEEEQKMASKKLKSIDDSSRPNSHQDSIKKKTLSNGAVIKDKLDTSDDAITVTGVIENGLSSNGSIEDADQTVHDDDEAHVEKVMKVDKRVTRKSKENRKFKDTDGDKVISEKSEENDSASSDKLTHLNSENVDGKLDEVNKKVNQKDKGDIEIVDKQEKVSKEQSGDGEKENKGQISTLSTGEKDGVSSKKSAMTKLKRSDSADNGTDDIEIIGESKVVKVSTNNTLLTQNVVFVPAALTGSVTSHNIITQGFTATHSSLLSTSNVQSPILVHTVGNGSSQPAFLAAGLTTLPSNYSFASGVQGQPGISLLTPSVAPPKPKSSLDQIELIRWEIQNRINTRPKYFKPNSSSELGPLAKFLFDIGSDLIKESVYHDLVKIQSKKSEDEKLTDKERDDLNKLKEIEKDLYATIGHLKLKLKKHCKGCNFQTESENVLYLHKQFPHEDGKILRCAHCSFTTKQAVTFKFHIEAEHNVQPKLPEKRAFYECDMCPYENNQEQKLTLHKQRCIKQFRPLFNLHPGCLSGAEINLCLENIFYKPVIPKNLKILQQKHAQQQAALAEARRQQAQVQALAAQKNAAAIAAKKIQQHQPRLPVNGPHLNFQNSARMPLTKLAGQQQPVRFSGVNVKTPRPTVASLLNNRQNQGANQAISPGGFEVCEICSGYVKDRKALRIHFFYAHRIDLPFNLFERNQAPLYCATCFVRFWTAQGLRKHIETHKGETQARGVVGKCISCFEQVTNLLLHMRVVHNRELQHYINALMCMFCGCHFGSRQECERHIVRVHGIIDPLTGAVRVNSGAAPPAPAKPTVNQKKTPGSNTLVKGSVCVLCNLNFGRNVDLTRHCMRMHHTCMKCGMVVIDKASLLKHTCLSSPSGTRDCSMCPETGFHPAYYVKHLRDKHLKKFSIKVRKLSKRVIERWTKRSYPFEDPEEILVEISDSDEENKPKSKPTVPPIKKYRMGPACKVKKYRENQLAATTEVVKIDDDSNDDDVLVEKVELPKEGKLFKGGKVSVQTKVKEESKVEIDDANDSTKTTKNEGDVNDTDIKETSETPKAENDFEDVKEAIEALKAESDSKDVKGAVEALKAESDSTDVKGAIEALKAESDSEEQCTEKVSHKRRLSGESHEEKEDVASPKKLKES